MLSPCMAYQNTSKIHLGKLLLRTKLAYAFLQILSSLQSNRYNYKDSITLAVRRHLALLPSIEQSGGDYPSSLEQRQESTFEHPFALSGDLAKHQCPLMALGVRPCFLGLRQYSVEDRTLLRAFVAPLDAAQAAFGMQIYDLVL